MKQTIYLDAQLTWGNNSERCEPACFPVHVTEHDSEHAKVKVLYYPQAINCPRHKTFTVTFKCLQFTKPSPVNLASWLQQRQARLPVLQLPAGERVIGRIAPIDVAPPRHTATALQSGSGGSVRIALHLCYVPSFRAAAASARSLHVFTFS